MFQYFEYIALLVALRKLKLVVCYNIAALLDQHCACAQSIFRKQILWIEYQNNVLLNI